MASSTWMNASSRPLTPTTKVSSARARLLMSSDTNSPTASSSRFSFASATGASKRPRRLSVYSTTRWGIARSLRLDAGRLRDRFPALHLRVGVGCELLRRRWHRLYPLFGQLRLDRRLGEHLV